MRKFLSLALLFSFLFLNFRFDENNSYYVLPFQTTDMRIGAHFYTTSDAERDNAVVKFGYKSEGISCYVFPSQATGPSPLYRLMNTNKGDHFFTTSITERDDAVAKFGYKSEGIACYVFTSQATGTESLYRLMSPNKIDHFYTTSATESDDAVANHGYKSEGIACYVFTSQATGTTSLYRLLNPNSGDHFYTTSATESDDAVANHGYKSEGIACYVLTSQTEEPTALYRLLNADNGDHFYTTSATESDDAVSNHGYKSEGIACYVFTSQATGTTALYRLLDPNNGHHFYTTSAIESDNAIAKLGYKSEGIACYVFDSQALGTTPLFRLVRVQPPPVDNDKDGIDDNLEHHLLEKFRPYLKFSKDYVGSELTEEHYNPTDVIYYIKNSNLCENESQYSIDVLASNPLVILSIDESGRGLSKITQNKTKTNYHLNPKETAHGISDYPGRHGNPWPEITSERNVGLYGHVVPIKLARPEDYHRERIFNGADIGNTYYKVEYWQFFGYNNANAPLSIGDHEGDWATIQLLVESGTEAIVSVFHYAHGTEIRFDLDKSISEVLLTDKSGLAVKEFRGSRYNIDNLDLNDSHRIQDSAQYNNIARFYRDPNGEYTHPVAYVEYGSHELWPSEYWKFLKGVWGKDYSAPPHGGDDANHCYLTSTPPNLGEVEAPLIETGAAPIILQYNGYWGCWNYYNNPPPGPPLHTEWTWPSNSSIRWLLTNVVEN
jgi:uncharacterized protein DUF5648